MPKEREQDEVKKPPRGVFQRPPGSGIWWINYYHHGKQYREKIGRQADAIQAYWDRKTILRREDKLPTVKRTAPVMVSDLVDLVLEYVKSRNHKDRRTYESRGKIIRTGKKSRTGKLIHKGIGDRNAETLTAHEIEAWLGRLCKEPATFNRYKAFLSLAYKLGIRARKVTHNPVRGDFIPQRPEPKGRLRFLNRDEDENEYATLRAVIERRFPERLAEFDVAVHTGMRLSEQYTVEVNQFDRRRRAIDLDKTKNGDARTVDLNDDAFAAIERAVVGRKRSERIFDCAGHAPASEDKPERFDNRSWFDVAVEEAGIPRITWHGLRHTFCSWLAMAGATAPQIMLAAGHKTLSQAARYTHLSPKHKQSVVNRIAGTGAIPLMGSRDSH